MIKMWLILIGCFGGGIHKFKALVIARIIKYGCSQQKPFAIGSGNHDGLIVQMFGIFKGLWSASNDDTAVARVRIDGLII